MTRPTMTVEQYEKLLRLVIETNNNLLNVCKRLTALEEFKDFAVTEFQTNISQIEQVQNTILDFYDEMGLRPKQPQGRDLSELINNGGLYLEGITNK